MTQSKFQYEPLPDENCHRLLRVCPRDQEQTIVCELRTQRLANGEDVLPYRALSYCWGSNVRDTPVLLKDAHTNKQGMLGVTDNLHAYLSAIAMAGDHDWIFVDAICINQDDLDERARQVRLMSRIYKSASKVVVWLGEDRHICYLLRWLREYLEAHYTTVPSGSQPVEFKDADVAAAWENDEDFRQGYKRLADHEYWTRLWIIPEFRLGKAVDVQCAREYLNWVALFHLRLDNAEHTQKRGDDVEPPYMLEILRHKRIVFSDALTRFSEYLTRFEHQQCSDLRDRVYALLALSSDSAKFPTSMISYELSASQLFFEVYVALIMPRSADIPDALLRALDLDTLSILEWASKTVVGSQVMKVYGCLIQPGTVCFGCGGTFDLTSHPTKADLAIWCVLREEKETSRSNAESETSIHVLMQAHEQPVEGHTTSDQVWTARGLLEDDGKISTLPLLASTNGDLAMQSFDWSTIRVNALYEFIFEDESPELMKDVGQVRRVDFDISYFGMAVLLRVAQSRWNNPTERTAT